MGSMAVAVGGERGLEMEWRRAASYGESLEKRSAKNQGVTFEELSIGLRFGFLGRSSQVAGPSVQCSTLRCITSAGARWGHG